MTFVAASGDDSALAGPMTPDVAFDANPNSGVAIYDSFQQSQPCIQVGGTSLGSPSWSAIVALADQQRGSSLGTYQVETTLYNVLSSSGYSVISGTGGSGTSLSFVTSGTAWIWGLGRSGSGGGLYSNTGSPTLTAASSQGAAQAASTPSSTASTLTYTDVFHDITSGNNGYSAGTGYDLVTGLGSPMANNLVPLLANTTVAPGLPTLTGTGTGPVSTSLSGFFSSGTSGFGEVGRAGGGGLYVAAGSPSLTAGSQAASGLGSNAAGPSLTPTVVPSTSTPVSSLASAMIPSAETPVARLSAGNPTGLGNNTLLALSLTTQASPPGPGSNGSSLSGPSNVPDPPSATVFGASGWSSSGNSWRLSSHDLHL